MGQFEIGDIINYKMFYNGVNVTEIGMVSSERKQLDAKFYKGEFGYYVLNEKNDMVFVLELYIEGTVK